jgi:hypothetical protein
MVKVKIAGRDYPAEGNFNTVCAFLKAVGRDTMEGLVNIADLRPSDYTELVAAAVNEGMRLDGSEARLSGQDVGASPDAFNEIPAAVAAIFGELSPGRQTADTAKKK